MSKSKKTKRQIVTVEIETELPQKVLRRINQVAIEDRGGVLMIGRNDDQGNGRIMQVRVQTVQTAGSKQ